MPDNCTCTCAPVTLMLKPGASGFQTNRRKTTSSKKPVESVTRTKKVLRPGSAPPGVPVNAPDDETFNQTGPFNFVKVSTSFALVSMTSPFKEPAYATFKVAAGLSSGSPVNCGPEK